MQQKDKDLHLRAMLFWAMENKIFNENSLTDRDKMCLDQLHYLIIKCLEILNET